MQTLSIEAMDAQAAQINTRAQVIVVRRDPQSGYTTSIGLGSTTVSLPGRHATPELAEHAGRVASVVEYTRQHAEILSARQRYGVDGIPLTPHLPTVLRCGVGQSAWSVYDGTEEPNTDREGAGFFGPAKPHPMDRINTLSATARQTRDPEDARRAQAVISLWRDTLVARQRRPAARSPEQVTDINSLGDLYREMRAIESPNS